MTHPLDKVVQHIRSVAASQGATDGELLYSFLQSDDQSAFAALAKRHGPLVLAVCRRILGNLEDAEDAFQATFVVLARNAAKLSQQGSLSSWLHGVAYRIALNARRLSARRRKHERQAKIMVTTNPAWNSAWREVQRLLDEEVQRLPEKYRDPFILCCLESQSYAAAARRLGVQEGTVGSRLTEARKRLQARLSRRGVELTAVLGAAALAPSAATAQVAPALVAKAVSAATTAAVPASVSVLVKGVAASLALKKAKVGVVLFLVFSGLVGTTSMWAVQKEPAEQVKAPPRQAAAEQEGSVKAELVVAKDLYGDPLPTGALARLGTVRWRHDGFIPFVGFLPDGKSLVSAGTEGPVIVRELVTGRELRRFNRVKVTDEIGGAIALSPKGELVICSGPLLQVYNGATGEKLAEVKTEGPAAAEVALTPDGKSLATIRLDGSISLYDRATLKEMHHLNQPSKPAKFQPKRRVASLAFSPDGKLLASVDFIKGPASESICLWDTSTGKEAQRVNGGLGGPPLARNQLQPANPLSPTFSPDGKLLAWIDRWGTAHVRVAATDKDVAQVQSVIGVAFTPDSKSLVACGRDGKGIWILDIESKSIKQVAHDEKFRLPNPTGNRDVRLPRQPVAVSPDGKVIAVGGEQHQIRFFELGSDRDRFAGLGHRFPVCWLSYTPDGRSVATWDTGDKIALWDIATGKSSEHMVLPDGVFFHVAIAPDLKMIAMTHATPGPPLLTNLEIRDTATHLIHHKLNRFVAGTIAPTAVFSPDGKALVAWGLGQTKASLYEARTGEKLRTLDLGDGMTPDQRGMITIPPFRGAAMVFSPDSRLLAMRSGGRTVGVWNVGSGRSVRPLSLPAYLPAEQWLGSGVFTPDGRSLAVEMGDGTITVWEIATGLERCRLIGEKKSKAEWTTRTSVPVSPIGENIGAFDDGRSGVGLAISPDGDLLAQAAGRTVRVWDLVDAKEITRLTGHDGNVTAVTFAPDGKTLATGSEDTTTLIWDVPTFSKDQKAATAALTQADIESLWGVLTGDNEAEAHRTIRALAAVSSQALPFFTKRLRPVALADKTKVAQWIADLDSDKFAVRQAAIKGLENVEAQAIEPVQKALKGNTSLEARRRLEQVLDTLSNSPNAETLRVIRAIAVLERIGSPDAQTVLRTLAGGAPGARETEEAKASLERLSQRTSRAP